MSGSRGGIVLVLLFVCLLNFPYPVGMNQIGLDMQKDDQNAVRKAVVAYTVRGIITIRSNSDFTSKYGFPGAGTEASPYLIQGYSITDSLSELIEIQGTTAWFVIKNCLLNNVLKNLDGIYLRNVLHFTIQNCTIMNSRHGVFVNRGCQDFALVGNNITQSSQSGIRMNDTDFSSIQDNFVQGNTYNGIWLNGSAYSSVTNNTVHTDGVGIWLVEGCTQVNVTHCTVYATGQAILVSNSSYENRIIGNLLYDSSLASQSTVGVALRHSAHDNSVLNNTIGGTLTHAIDIDGTSASNLIKWNSLIGNNQAGTSQACDNGTSNIIDYNFWDTWTTPDNDPPYGIVDVPYAIDGTSGNSDPHPLTQPVNPVPYHYLTPVTLLHPNGGESIAEGATVEWTEVTDSAAHAVTYTLFYSENGGSDWTEMVSGLASTQYDWDATLLPKSSSYLIKVVAECAESLVAEDVSDGTFTLLAHSISVPTILYPSGGETLSGLLTITWNGSVDSWGHAVTYTVFYYTGSGQEWVVMYSGITGTSCQWDTKNVANGTGYQFRVIAQCASEAVAEDVSGLVTIENASTTATTTTTTSTTPGGGDAMLLMAGLAIVGGVAVIIVLFLLRQKGFILKPST